MIEEFDLKKFKAELIRGYKMAQEEWAIQKNKKSPLSVLFDEHDDKEGKADK